MVLNALPGLLHFPEGIWVGIHPVETTWILRPSLTLVCAVLPEGQFFNNNLPASVGRMLLVFERLLCPLFHCLLYHLVFKKMFPERIYKIITKRKRGTKQQKINTAMLGILPEVRPK